MLCGVDGWGGNGLGWRESSFFLEICKEFHFVARKASMSLYIVFDVVGLSWVSQ